MFLTRWPSYTILGPIPQSQTQTFFPKEPPLGPRTCEVTSGTEATMWNLRLPYWRTHPSVYDCGLRDNQAASLPSNLSHRFSQAFFWPLMSLSRNRMGTLSETYPDPHASNANPYPISPRCQMIAASAGNSHHSICLALKQFQNGGATGRRTRMPFLEFPIIMVSHGHSNLLVTLTQCLSL